MPLADYEQWKLYAQLEPFGSHFDDLRSGQVVAAVYNVNRDIAKHPKGFMPLEFAPWNDVQKTITEAPPEIEDPENRADRIRALLGFKK
jgi:hypothetical protein